MSAVTAREVLALLERRGARLLAGESGLDRPITWASGMRARPPAFEALQGGELALLSLATLRALRAQDDSLTLTRLVADLAERGVAAIAVAGLIPPAGPPAAAPCATPPPAAGGGPATPRPLIPAAPSSGEGDKRAPTPEELALAARMNLPLLALPPHTPLAEVERDVIAYVVARRAGAQEPEATRDVYDALMRASLRGDDDRALGQRMANLLGAAVAVEDAADVRWCFVPPGFPIEREPLVALLRRPSARAQLTAPNGGRAGVHGVEPGDQEPEPRRVERALPLAGGLTRLVAPLQARQGVAAWLSLVVVDESSAAEGAAHTLVAVLDQVAPLFALALARRHDLTGAEQRLRAETLDALLAGTYVDEGQMQARAAQLGHDLARPHAGMVVDLSARDAAGGGAHDASRALAARVAEALAAGLEGAWTRAHGDEAVALVPLAASWGPGDLAELAARAAELLGSAVGTADVAWVAGLGDGGIGPAEVRRSYEEARDAARLGLEVLGPGRVARTADLGVYRLLLRLRDTGELEDFYRRTLGPITADPRRSEDLLETLEVFFACNGNLSEAARRLDLHRNSLIYRLGRARDLLGHDLEDPEIRLSLQLALKARRVLQL